MPNLFLKPHEPLYVSIAVANLFTALPKVSRFSCVN